MQSDFFTANIDVITAPNPNDLTENGTTLELTCTQRNHYFDFSVPDDLISFFYSENINRTVLTCNQDR